MYGKRKNGNLFLTEIGINQCCFNWSPPKRLRSDETSGMLGDCCIVFVANFPVGVDNTQEVFEKSKAFMYKPSSPRSGDLSLKD